MMIPISSITLDKRLQLRVQENPEAIQEWATSMIAGVVYPDVKLMQVDEVLYLCDGWHRLKAAVRAEKSEIGAEIVVGTWRDALLAAIGANAQHGIRRTNEDKQRAVRTLLCDPEWAKMSNRDLGALAGVSHEMIRKVRDQLEQEDPESLSPDMIEEPAQYDALPLALLARIALKWTLVKGKSYADWNASQALTKALNAERDRRAATCPARRAPSNWTSSTGALNVADRPTLDMEEFIQVRIGTTSGVYGQVQEYLVYAVGKRRLSTLTWKTAATLYKFLARGEIVRSDGVVGAIVPYQGGAPFCVLEPRFRVFYGTIPKYQSDGSVIEPNPEWLECGLKPATFDDYFAGLVRQDHWPWGYAEEGMRAYEAGRPAESNPLPLHSQGWHDWFAGYRLGMQRNTYPALRDAFSDGVAVVLRGEPQNREYSKDSLLNSEYRRGLERGAEARRAYDRARKLDALRENCAHPMRVFEGGQVFCVWCGLPTPDAEADVVLAAPEAPVEVEVEEEDTEAEEDSDDDWEEA